jgi:hypothetical protein
MKNKLLYLLLILVGVLGACDNNEDTDYIFEKSINERFMELKSEYNAKLTAPENGWIGYYNPNGESGAVTLLLKFRERGDVVMHSDYQYGAVNDTITYGIKKKQDIVMVFESWSVLHSIYEIKNNNNGGEFVFNISEITEDEITLTSKKDNGYGGDEVTELVLRPASLEEWNLEPVYESVKNLAGDPTKSVFRNLKSGDSPLASFAYDASKRSAVISYMEGSTLQQVSSPLRITPEGFCLIKALEIKGTTIECFEYNAEDATYKDRTHGVSLVYDMVPGVPLAPYDFGNKSGARYNFLEEGKSSAAFVTFLKEYTASMAEQGVSIDRIYMRDLNAAGPYFHIYTNLGNVWFDFTYEVKENGRVYFTLTGATNAGGLAPLFQPLLDKWVNINGHYIEGTGGLLNYSNRTFSLINADDPSLKINFYDF